MLQNVAFCQLTSALVFSSALCLRRTDILDYLLIDGVFFVSRTATAVLGKERLGVSMPHPYIALLAQSVIRWLQKDILFLQEEPYKDRQKLETRLGS